MKLWQQWEMEEKERELRNSQARGCVRDWAERETYKRYLFSGEVSLSGYI